jgi:uncharacterized damage-inducible protein DinB
MKAVNNQTEAWLLGTVDGYPDSLLPVAHALLQARTELRFLRTDVSDAEAHLTPGGAASIGFHVAHIAGSLDRLFSYARGEALNPTQFEFLRREAERGLTWTTTDLATATLSRINQCLMTLRHTPNEMLSQRRTVGRNQLPSTVRGLLFHAAEHTTMHMGQIRTTLKIIRGLASQSDRRPSY